MKQLIEFNENGMYVRAADVYIDPWRPVKRAIITHAHSDHARWGMGAYLSQHQSIPFLKRRLGDGIYEGLNYRQSIQINGVEITLFPSGHVPGAAQVRVKYEGETWVASGDYKTVDDGISEPFEPVLCDTFITESTFGLPVFNWPELAVLTHQINQWWQQNIYEQKCSVVFAYSLGKAQRILQMLNPELGKIYVHGAVASMNEACIEAGLTLHTYHTVQPSTTDYAGALVIAPPSALGSPWLKKFEPYDTAMASGWMNMRGTRRRNAVDTGFVISDHADWQGLNNAIKNTGAEQVIVTHGYTAIFAKWLSENGYQAIDVKTAYEGETLINNDSE
ncbi:MAG: ligase-associated DNA damage response exonuclease [Bacteroidia bacterium]|jgi:putative mRNA 3-end processing factor|nr:ligase-associated DNA damage response exonuclease [Bacteroidia bacterium]